MTKIALITGASRGLGKSMALHLARAGRDVILTYNANKAEAEAVAAEIAGLGRKSAVLQLDVSQSAGFTAFAAKVKAALAETWQRDDFDFLVNNAGTALYAPFMQTTEEQFDRVMAVHFKATFFLTQKLVPLIKDGGRIVNISSGLARFSHPGSSAYGSMKAGVETLSRYMAKELAERRIAVNVIAPGAIETDFGGGRVRNDRELNTAIAAQTALGRVGLPDDVGGAVAALLSDDAGWINGQRIEVAGGINL
jgi:NAD(P)-dependent dehydrogenase (short-subunit alcohol dehydrogenase family)